MFVLQIPFLGSSLNFNFVTVIGLDLVVVDGCLTRQITLEMSGYLVRVY